MIWPVIRLTDAPIISHQPASAKASTSESAQKSAPVVKDVSALPTNKVRQDASMVNSDLWKTAITCPLCREFIRPMSVALTNLRNASNDIVPFTYIGQLINTERQMIKSLNS